MSMTKELDNLYEKMYTHPLSTILPMLLPYALECEDYEGYCILNYWGNPLSKDVNTNKVLYGEMKKILALEGIPQEKIEELERVSFDKYIALRMVEKDKCMCYSAKEMENKIKTLNDMMDSIEPPQGLAPVDLYFRSEKVAQSKLNAIRTRSEIEQQYVTLQSYLIAKISEYRRKLVLKERKKDLGKRNINSRDIFIIHGHNEAKRRELESLLKERFGLNPIVLSDQPDQGLTIIEKFEKYATNCAYAFALFTPDDIVTNGGKRYFQARPNVIFELGWFYANLGRSRVCILDQASEESQIFSDLQGIMRMQFNNNISEKYFEIERELKHIGII